MGIFFDIYVFIAWFGSWSSSSGFGAFVMFFAWTGLLAFSVAASYCGGKISTFLTVLKVLASCFTLGLAFFAVPIIAVVCWILYFCGLGDWLNSAMPSMFPAGGYFFSEASASWIEWLLFGAWVVLRASSAKFMIKLSQS